MNSNQQLEHALLTASLSGVSPDSNGGRLGSTLAQGLYVASCMAVAVALGDDFAPRYGNPVQQTPQRDYLPAYGSNGLDLAPTGLQNVESHCPASKRVKLPLIRSRHPGTVLLTNAQIEELLD